MYIQANKISKNFSGSPLFEEVSLQINEQNKIGLVGQNGTGKTTLLQILLKNEGVDQGVLAHKKGLTVGWIPQNLVSDSETTFSYIYQSFTELSEIREQLQKYEIQMMDLDEEMEKVIFLYGNLQEKFEEKGGYQLEDRIRSTMKGLGLEDKLDSPLNHLSGGERVRVELAKILTQEKDVLFLDEPTNHLDLQGIEWLENYLKLTKSAYIVISHDRAFLDQVTTKIIEIEDQQLIEYPGNYSTYRKLKKERDVSIQKSYDLQQKEIQRIRKMIRRYRQWGNEGDNEDFFRKAKELERRLEKMTLVKPPQEVSSRLSHINQAGTSGKEVVIAEGIGKIMGEKILFSESSFQIFRGERIAIMGENGSGKTTLLNLILGHETLDEGSLKVGASVKIGYLPQKLIFDDLNQRILSYVMNSLPNEQEARRQLAHFGFFSMDVTKRIKDLSGGEQVRLYLLQLLQQKINFLILDEPTNHLDIYAREEIEELLATFTGTLLVVTHDRYFLEKNFTQALLIEEGIQKIDI